MEETRNSFRILVGEPIGKFATCKTVVEMVK
jgi:hypothetical protein